jgi:hypothetical protein
MKVIKIPKTPKSAFNPSRPASTLLKAQVEQLEAATGIHAGDTRERRRPRTEGEAAKYIEQLTRGLHPEGAAAPPPHRANSARRGPRPGMPPEAPKAPSQARRRAGSRSAAKKSAGSKPARSPKRRRARRTPR